MTTLVFDTHLRAGEDRAIARLRHAWAEADGYDPRSIDGTLPSKDRLVAELSAADPVVIARLGDRIQGYGRTISWTDTDGTRVHLLDTYSAPGAERGAVDAGLLLSLEQHVVGDPSDLRVVFGANAETDDTDRIAVLTGLGYSLTFELVELELHRRLTSGPIPAGITVRPARLTDASAIAQLTDDNYADRPHFRLPSVDEIARWLSKNDPELFLLAEADNDLVGLVVANLTEQVVEIEDLGVHPSRRRRGLALGLMTEILDRIEARSTLPVRLTTGGANPSGALTLYERLGFEIVARHGRFRKS